ncbi:MULTISPECIES: antitoxin Xre/MbcA/ParS toxin-binding domain-containing protein [unclassified Microbulbifer]|uniref:antitoxin Xre/MbcA/ParS toxin-binding domain-containing protein n=1 Tax=unclassified Microbulbifer TaxID=2619833 RepID=UPI0027E4CE08|nr:MULTISPECIES: antitoxin Xre/MbcA/ParS toxin-binding domain-containing protein [unclassified Microbulbifer]
MTAVLSYEQAAEVLHQDPITFLSPAAQVKAVQKGISGPDAKKVVLKSHMHRVILEHALGLTSSNLSRVFRRKKLTQSQAEVVLDVVRLWLRAAEVFGTQEKANAWMQSKVPALEGATPAELMRYAQGRRMVDEALDRIATGDFA